MEFKNKNFRFYILILIFDFLILNFLTGCEKSPSAKGKEEAIPVRVMKVQLKDLHSALEYVGNIKGKDEAILYPKVTGKIIEKVKDENSPVSKGEAIVYIDRDEVGLKFEKAPVESPITGTVGRIYVDIGSSVSPQTPVALVTNMESVRIVLDVPENYLPKIALGQKAGVSVDAYPERVFSGSVTKLSPVVDVETRTAPIEIAIDDDERLLRSGMFAKVRLILAEYKDVPVILKEAIMGKAPDAYVFVADNGKASLRKVILGIREGPYFEVKDGLAEGDLVVIMGQQRLRDGSAVATEE